MTKQTAIPAYKNRRAVFLHLKQAGYELSERKLYRDFKNGLVRLEPDGQVYEIEVREYIRKHLEGGSPDYQALRSKKEVEKLDEQIAKLRFDREKDQGKYIKRDDFAAEMVARALAFEAGFRRLFDDRIREWIAIVNGKHSKSPEFLAALNQGLDDCLNDFASDKIYHVMIDLQKEDV